MSTFMTFWTAWSYPFRALPGGDPYIAAFVLVIVAVLAIKMIRRASTFFYI